MHFSQVNDSLSVKVKISGWSEKGNAPHLKRALNQIGWVKSGADLKNQPGILDIPSTTWSASIELDWSRLAEGAKDPSKLKILARIEEALLIINTTEHPDHTSGLAFCQCGMRRSWIYLPWASKSTKED